MRRGIPIRFQRVFDVFKAALEFAIGGAQSFFGVDFEVSGEVGHDEHQIPKFFDLFGMGEGVFCLDQLCRFFFNFVEDLGGFRPVEADTGGAFLEFYRSG